MPHARTTAVQQHALVGFRNLAWEPPRADHPVAPVRPHSPHLVSNGCQMNTSNVVQQLQNPHALRVRRSNERGFERLQTSVQQLFDRQNTRANMGSVSPVGLSGGTRGRASRVRLSVDSQFTRTRHEQATQFAYLSVDDEKGGVEKT
jgi:hypothetical protein